jgi:hypothetical protein
MKTVLLDGNQAHRYDGNKRIETADIPSDLAPAHQRAAIEDFRRDGLQMEAPSAGELAFDRIVNEAVGGNWSWGATQ